MGGWRWEVHGGILTLPNCTSSSSSSSMLPQQPTRWAKPSLLMSYRPPLSIDTLYCSASFLCAFSELHFTHFTLCIQGRVWSLLCLTSFWRPFRVLFLSTLAQVIILNILIMTILIDISTGPVIIMNILSTNISQYYCHEYSFQTFPCFLLE